MSQNLKCNYSIWDKTAKKAVEDYAAILENAFEKYQNLWLNYVILQEKYEQCNASSSSETIIDKNKDKDKGELTPEKHLNDKENDNVPTLELNTLDINFSNLDYSLHKNEGNNTTSKSPVLSGKYFKTINTSMKKCMDSSRNIKETLSKCNKTLGFSTTRHVETTFLPDGKKFKQSQLVFHPIKRKENIISSLNTDKLESTSAPPNVEKKSMNPDIFIEKTFVTKQDNVINIYETIPEDVIELSPTERNIRSKTRNCLKLKRRIPIKQIAEASTNRNKYHTPDPSIAAHIKVDEVNSMVCSSPEHTSVQVRIHEPTINVLKEKSNGNDYLPVQKRDDIYLKTSPKDVKRKNQLTVNKVQDLQNADNFTQADETFFLPAEQFVNKDYLDYLNIGDTENKPPVKKMLLDNTDILPETTENSTHLNLRCKTDRAKLSGRDCWECEKYYGNLRLSKKELQKRKNQCSRHRQKYERPNTPEGFWNPEFSDTSFSTLN